MYTTTSPVLECPWVSTVGMVGGEQESNLTRYSNLRIYKLFVINSNFVLEYLDAAVMQYLCKLTFATAPGYGWSESGRI